MTGKTAGRLAAPLGPAREDDQDDAIAARPDGGGLWSGPLWIELGVNVVSSSPRSWSGQHGALLQRRPQRTIGSSKV
ncbi:Mucin-16 [Frankliniella fusca]|uniref:Mucin-16 n=1 Tax=Frankliniella fusca TaxID=407009 RepID=A0AAE1GUI3_9NEOP|nr:Mucin-16 [Frankliniella fusca]